MVIREIFPWKITYDYEATRKAYAQINVGDPERCRCEHCLNFAAVRDEVYPREVREVFEEIGIDYRKESEVYHLYKISPGSHEYGGWFNFIGTVEYIDESYRPSKEKPGWLKYVTVSESFSWFFSDYRVEAYHKAFSNQPIVQIDFNAIVPWVLKAKEPD